MNYFPALFHGFIPKIPSLLQLPFPPYDAGYLNKPFPSDQECFAIMKRNISPLQKLRPRTILRRHSPTPLQGYAVTGTRLFPYLQIKKSSRWEQPVTVRQIPAA
ncbi:hypothetical protein [uncultured Akkermansia sp.]|uniref:hypothetical protein n=1 Tax=uncultured Akkermansia sp. TaxID=512294 RepID=UPI0026018E2F|nr:hypothetical protein [uncultured Akkermansia sp.]